MSPAVLIAYGLLLVFFAPVVLFLLYILADGLRSACRWALARWRSGRADAFDEACALTTDEFAGIAAELAPDFEHIDIRRLSALYLVTQETL